MEIFLAGLCVLLTGLLVWEKKKGKADRKRTRRVGLRRHGEPVPQPAAADAPFRREFHFRGRQESDLEKINAELRDLELDDLTLEDFDGYLATETTVSPTGKESVRYWYGLDNCVLTGRRTAPGAGFRYRLEAVTTQGDDELCTEQWRQAHPDRVLRLRIVVEYDNVKAMLLLHHPKKTVHMSRPEESAPGSHDW